MKAGRELDALVAEKVMRSGKLEGTYIQGVDQAAGIITYGIEWHCPPYSTDIAAAWGVVEKLKEIGWNSALSNCGKEWGVWLSKEWIGDNLVGAPDARAEGAPHAICLAALKAVGAL